MLSRSGQSIPMYVSFWNVFFLLFHYKKTKIFVYGKKKIYKKTFDVHFRRKIYLYRIMNAFLSFFQEKICFFLLPENKLFSPII